MISGFGVDHDGISKSFIPGVGYKAAKDMDTVERGIVGIKAAGNRTQMRLKGTPAQNAKSSAGRKIWPEQKTTQGKLTRVVASRHQTGFHRGAMKSVEGFSTFDGRGGGHVVIHDDVKDFKAVSRHEMAHVTPRRNPVRFQQRAQDPFRHGSEEGRADFIGSGHITPGQYPGSGDFQRGYNQVQSQMAYAQARKARKPRG